MSNLVQIELDDSADNMLALWGANAVIAIESSADAVTWAEIGTVPIESGVETYTYADQSVSDIAQYRIRYSNSTRTRQSRYSNIVAATDPGPLLSVDEFREHISTTLSDSAVQRLLDANAMAIAERAGPLGTASLTLTPSRDRYLFLDRPVSAITSITEYFNDPVGISGIVLDSTDYRLLSGGTLLERWGYGTHPGDWWSDRVELVYTPVDDTAERIRVLIKLCELDLNRKPGLSAISIGDYSEQSRNEAYNDEREAILASLVPSALTFA